MRKTFRHYLRPTKAEFEALWKDCIFVFDASVLLNVYGYSSETREELVSLAEKNAHRIRLPHQFGLEYARNRSAVIIKQVDNYKLVEKELIRIRRTFIDPKRDHPYLSKRSLKAYDAIQSELELSRKEMEKLIGNDPYCDRILQIFEGRIGPEPMAEDLARFHSEGAERYSNLVPPGFADLAKKGTPAAYGDYIAWCQIIQIGKLEKKPIILVTDDVKDDWWQIEKERTVGPLPQLIEEFSRNVQQPFYMYNSESFLRQAQEHFGAEIKEGAIQEVKERLESQWQGVLDAASEKTTIRIGDVRPQLLIPDWAALELKPPNPDLVSALTGLKLKPWGPDFAPALEELKLKPPSVDFASALEGLELKPPNLGFPLALEGLRFGPFAVDTSQKSQEGGKSSPSVEPERKEDDPPKPGTKN